MVPYVNSRKDLAKFEDIPYGPFIYYETGDKYPNERSEDSVYYCKPLDGFTWNYMNHKEPNPTAQTKTRPDY
jgi:hypothetical protein